MSLSVSSARPNVHKTRHANSFLDGLIPLKRNSSKGVTATGSAQIKAAFESDVSDIPYA